MSTRVSGETKAMVGKMAQKEHRSLSAMLRLLIDEALKAREGK